MDPEPAPSTSSVIARRAKRIVRIVIGFTLLLVGAVFGLVPLIPGWPLGLAGLVLLAAEFVWARKVLDRVKRGGNQLRDVLWPRRRNPPTD